MIISIHSELKTKFVHTQELNLRKDGYKPYQINLNAIDKEENQQEKTAIDTLLTDLHAIYISGSDPETHEPNIKTNNLMDIMQVAMDDEGHNIVLIDIYDVYVDSIEEVKAIFNKNAKNICGETTLSFVETPDASEFQLTIKQVQENEVTPVN